MLISPPLGVRPEDAAGGPWRATVSDANSPAKGVERSCFYQEEIENVLLNERRSAEDVLVRLPFVKSPTHSLASLTTAFRNHYSQLLRYCRMRIRNHDDAEDIVQDAFLSMRRAYPDKPPEELQPLLFTTVRNLAANYLKSGRVRQQRRSDDIGAMEDLVACQRTPTPEQELMDAQLLAIAEQAIEDMPPRRRDALRMHRLEGLTYDLIAKRLSVSPTTVKTDIAEAIAEIAERLARAGGGAAGQDR